MARNSTRRSRLDSDDEVGTSRHSTPVSTAPNDRKRARRGAPQDDDTDSSETDSPPQILSQRGTTMHSQINSQTPGFTIGSAKHQPGAIVRVKLNNFVTYTSAEFFPGPNLNMIIGPNGTGKSTLVCAICLGLGWGTQYLGRAKDASEFVKHGCREATIEIELQRQNTGTNIPRRNIVITRTIKREGNKSTYTLNGNSSTGKAIQALAQNMFNIQIDNLCQFLPQDKVVEFAQMTPIEILRSTQRAAASPEMIKHQDQLVKLRAIQKELMGGNKGDREELQNLQNRQEMQRTEVERLRERVVVKKKLEWLEKCRPIPQYTVAKKKITEAKAEQKRCAAELKKLQEELGPTLRKVNAKQAYEQQVKAWKQQCQTAVTSSEAKSDAVQRKIADLEERLKEFDNNTNAEKTSILPKKNEIRRLQQNVAKYKSQKEQPPPSFDARAINQEMQDRNNRIREIDDNSVEIRNRQEELLDQGRARKSAMLDLQKKLENMDTQTGQRLQKLEILSRDTFKAWEWIQEHQNEFEQPILGPPIIECSLKDPRWADAIETLLQESDYRIITAQNDRDFRLLQQRLNRDQNLHQISLRTCNMQNLDQFQRALPQEEMHRNGLDSWAIDHLEGPPTVIAMLCIERNLHQCAISSNDVNQEQHERLSKSTLRSYVAGNKLYSFVRRAEYGAGATITNTRNLKRAEKWTNQTMDHGRKARIEREFAEKRGEQTIVKQELQECKAKVDELATEKMSLQQEIDELRTSKEEKQKALVEWNALDTKIKNEEEKAQKIQENLSGIRARLAEIAAEKDQTMIQKAEAVIKFAETLSEIKNCVAKLIEAEMMYIEAQSDFEVLSRQNQSIRDLLLQKQAEEREAQAVSTAQLTEAKRLVELCKDLRKQAVKLEEDQGDSGFLDLLREIGDKSLSSEDLEVEIDSQKAQLELTEGGDANTIKEFEERAKTIERLRKRVAEFDQQQDEHKHAIREVRAAWEPELDKLVTKISEAFSDSFSRIGCAGQVAVYKASSDDPADCTEENGGTENGLDFANWAVHISVKFRENEPLSLLDSHRQSGGERAVSTIFYLMALQSLSRAPFRVVDEINQGMDPRNERMVHGRMVDIAADNGGSQYFLITPKLLSGLKYRRGMTVLCIVSGENMPAATTIKDGKVTDNIKVDFRAFARKARDLGYGNLDGTSSEERRVDSGVGMGDNFSGLTNGMGNGQGSRVAEVGA